MAEMLRGHKTQTGRGSGERVAALDGYLNWLRPHGHAPDPRSGRWSAVDHELANLHARYERACVED